MKKIGYQVNKIHRVNKVIRLKKNKNKIVIMKKDQTAIIR